tara:strand:+ start:118 stop:522 length:405 start_codon:yes stop_codon:yes gene_type:complete
MKKLLALLLLSPLVISEELKLTCEAGAQIWFIAFRLDGTEAYYFRHEIPYIDSPEMLTPELINKSIYEEKKLFKKYWIYPSYIEFKEVNRPKNGGTITIVINRLTLKGRIMSSARLSEDSAKCYRGFKSYEKKI